MFLSRSASSILIDLNKKQLFFKQANRPTQSYSIAIGKASTPSPIGQWKIINKKILSEDSVFGSRWLGLSAKGYGIHGTNNPASIGTAVSSGCIRMHNQDIEQIFPLVSLGTAVSIVASAGDENYSSFHLVQAGDTLWSIAQQYHLDFTALLAANPQSNPKQLLIGTTVILP